MRGGGQGESRIGTGERLLVRGGQEEFAGAFLLLFWGTTEEEARGFEPVATVVDAATREADGLGWNAFAEGFHQVGITRETGVVGTQAEGRTEFVRQEGVFKLGVGEDALV